MKVNLNNQKEKRDVDDDYIQNYIQNRNVRPHLEEGFGCSTKSGIIMIRDNNEWLFADYNLLLSMIQDESNALLPNETIRKVFCSLYTSRT